MAEDFAGRMKAVQELAALHVEAGVGFHQVGGEAVRSRSVTKGSVGGWDVRAYEPFNALVLHAQAVERGVADGSMEFITPVQARRSGAESVAGDGDRFLVETADRRGVAIGLAGKPAILQRPPAYLVLHVETQTDLAGVGDPRRVRGTEAEVTAAGLVGRVVEAAGEKVVGAAFGAGGAHPARSGFAGPGEWASAVVSEVAAAVSGDAELAGDVRLARLERDAVRRRNAAVKRSKAAGERVGLGTREAEELLSEAVGSLYRRAVGVVERARGVKVDFDRPDGHGSFDTAGRRLRPRALRTFGPDGPGSRERFYRQVLVDVVEAAGGDAVRAAARTAVERTDRAAGLGLVRAVAGAVPGLDHRPALGGDEALARGRLVGAVAARALVEAAGLEFAPVASDEEVDRVQAAVARREGFRSLCSDGANVGLWLVEARERERGRVGARAAGEIGGPVEVGVGQVPVVDERGSGRAVEQPSLW